MIELALEKNLDLFFLQPVANEDQDIALQIMKHPARSDVLGFRRACVAAHGLVTADPPARSWVREKQAFTLERAVQMLTCVPATLWVSTTAVSSRRDGSRLAVFDPDRDSHDAGSSRRSSGRRSAVGSAHARDESDGRQRAGPSATTGKHTGALPGKLLRRSAVGAWTSQIFGTAEPALCAATAA